MTAMPRVTILVADDDEDDRQLILEALTQCRLAADLHFVNDGQALLDYLRHDGQRPPAHSPRPTLILLDLNMPRMSGTEALAEIKADAALREIPIVILTTSRTDKDVRVTYELGASSYIAKPVTYDGLVAAMASLKQYWFELVELPPERVP